MKFINVFFLLLIPVFLISQSKYEVGLFIGATEYQGDLAENHIEFGETKLAIGGVFTYRVLNAVKLRGNIYKGFISGDDNNSPSLATRGFSFEADIYEIGFGAELSPLMYFNKKLPEVNQMKFDVFVFSGIGYTYAKAKVLTKKPEDIGLFPEKDDRSGFMHGAIGTGGKIYFNNLASFGVEIGWRNVFSDYLDGVSQNGKPENNDWYVFGGFTLNLVLDSIIY